MSPPPAKGENGEVFFSALLRLLFVSSGFWINVPPAPRKGDAGGTDMEGIGL